MIRFRHSLTRIKLTKMLAKLLRSQRESKELLLREVAALIEVDTALISKMEKGDRKPTREQVEKLAVALDLNPTQLLTLWLSERVYEDVKGEQQAQEALKLVLKRIKEESSK